MKVLEAASLPRLSFFLQLSTSFFLSTYYLPNHLPLTEHTSSTSNTEATQLWALYFFTTVHWSIDSHHHVNVQRKGH